MKIPNGHGAIVDQRKLADYCLNPLHPRGRHKARVFEKRLGLTALDLELLERALLNAAESRETATPGRNDEFGRRYILDFEMDGPQGSGIIRSSWIIRTGEEFPRLATCYVL